MTSRQMRVAQMSMMLVFYGIGALLHPSRLVGHLRSLFGGSETSAVDQLIRTKRRGFRRIEPSARPAEPVAA
jgi:hypothetical protein